ncbi:hypothetical protein JB92DRAFT_3135026 [Gautieria morchelliformis]|nr:hypothetical protein JB92DRAFT_3135026 [Gautieria morchelliformis]
MAVQQHTQARDQEALFANEAVIEWARAAARDESRKAQLPDLVPGFKASALNVGPQGKLAKGRRMRLANQSPSTLPPKHPPASPFVHRHKLTVCPPTAILPKADEAFRAFRYMLYTSLSLSAHIKASRGEEDFVVNAHRGLTARGLDRMNEKHILTVERYRAAKAAVTIRSFIRLTELGGET